VSLSKRALKNLVLDTVFPIEGLMEKIMQLSPLEFVPGLLQIFRSRTAPTIPYFKILPPHPDRLWAIYLLLLKKDGHFARM
jgi:hypothetical protein